VKIRLVAAARQGNGNEPNRASALVPQPQPHFTVSIWCSVTSAFTGGMPMTWRRSVPVTSPRR
jgi:hypothetical protein